jgi:hypothetical protein
MAVTRAVTDSVQAFAVLLSDFRQRITKVELTAHTHRSPSNFLTPAGVIVEYIGAVVPDGWLFLDGSTIVGGEFLFPALWAVAPVGWKSGSDIVLPTQAGYMVRAF